MKLMELMIGDYELKASYFLILINLFSLQKYLPPKNTEPFFTTCCAPISHSSFFVFPGLKDWLPAPSKLGKYWTFLQKGYDLSLILKAIVGE